MGPDASQKQTIVDKSVMTKSGICHRHPMATVDAIESKHYLVDQLNATFVSRSIRWCHTIHMRQPLDTKDAINVDLLGSPSGT